MASTTDIREWAKQQGLEVKAKGPLGDDVRARYAEAHEPPGADPLPGLEDETVIGAVAAANVATAAPPPDKQAETRPSRPRPAPRSGGLLGKLRGGAGPAKPGKARPAAKRVPRVSIANLIEDAWGQMAWASGQLPPMQRLLQAQAPFAGIALEDALAGTVVDRVLQPIARAEDKAKAVGGLMFPPMALMMALATAPAPEYVEGTDPPQYVFAEPSTQHKGALMTLRWSLMLWSEAGAARLEEYRERAEANNERGAQADRFMAWILGYDDGGQDQAADDPAAGVVAAAVSAEDEAVARAQQMFGG